MNEEEKKEQVFRRRVDTLKNKIWSKTDLEGRSAEVVLQAFAELTAEITTSCVDPADIQDVLTSVTDVIHSSAGIGNETSH